MPRSVRQELIEALDIMESRLSNGYSSVGLALYRLAFSNGLPLSQEAHEQLGLLLRRERRKFNVTESLPPEVVEVAMQMESHFWEDSEAAPPLSRAQAIHLIRQLRAKIVASRPSVIELRANH